MFHIYLEDTMIALFDTGLAARIETAVLDYLRQFFGSENPTHINSLSTR